MFSGILDDFLHYRKTKKNDLRSIALHLALIYQTGNTNNSDLNDQLYNDLQKIIDQKVEFLIPILGYFPYLHWLELWPIISFVF